MHFTLGSSIAQPARRCPHPGCSAIARRVPDDLSYALDGYVWVCAAGHRVIDRHLASLDPVQRRDDARLRFEQTVDRLVAPPHEWADGTAAPALEIDELLQSLVDAAAELTSADAAGLLRADPDGRVRLIASAEWSEDLAGFLEEAGLDGHPFAGRIASGRPITVADIGALPPGWAVFAEAAEARRFRSAHAAPIRIGGWARCSIGLFAARTRAFGSDERAVVQALIDVAGIGLLQQRLMQRAQVVSQHLQLALENRVLIEQAKGVVSARQGVTLDAALRSMRDRAGAAGLALSEVARRIIDRTLDVDARR